MFRQHDFRQLVQNLSIYRLNGVWEQASQVDTVCLTSGHVSTSKCKQLLTESTVKFVLAVNGKSLCCGKPFILFVLCAL